MLAVLFMISAQMNMTQLPQTSATAANGHKQVDLTSVRQCASWACPSRLSQLDDTDAVTAAKVHLHADCRKTAAPENYSRLPSSEVGDRLQPSADRPEPGTNMAKDKYQSDRMESVSSPGVRQGKPKVTSEGRIKTFGGGSSVAKGDLSPRMSAPIVNGR